MTSETQTNGAPPHNAPDSKEPRSNIPELSVSDLASAVKKTLEDSFGRVRVRGELSRVSLPASGHMYSDLKDDNAVINVICWKGTLSRLSIKPEEGLEVIITGRMTTYPARSNYQLVIESMELAGEGALLKMLEDRKKRLAAEGLFDATRKRPLPFIPHTIGVITSPTGAVLRDIMHRLNDRFPRRVLVWPVLVQGAGAADQVTRAIEGFNALPAHQDGMKPGTLTRPDLLIVARGGGSLEDLMAFNEENVVRAVSNSQIPVISAIGHETDTTLIDYVSDRRAPTPTGAAEMAVPRRLDLIAQINENEQRLLGSATRTITQGHERLSALTNRLGKPERLLEMKTQKLDYALQSLTSHFHQQIARRQTTLARLCGGLRTPDALLRDKKRALSHVVQSLQTGLQQQISTRQTILAHLCGGLRTPDSLLRDKKQSLAHITQSLETVQKRILPDKKRDLERLDRMMESLSPLNVLKRGYSVVYDEAGIAVTGQKALQPGQNITIAFQDGKTDAVVAGASKTSPKPPSKKPSAQQTDGKKTTKNQGQLF
jgi:exodeoxyribonuclease VII large subunit